MVLPECGEEAPPGLNVSTIYNEVDKELDFGVLSAENGLLARAYKVCWCQLAPARGHYCDAASESLGFFRLDIRSSRFSKPYALNPIMLERPHMFRFRAEIGSVRFLCSRRFVDRDQDGICELCPMMFQTAGGWDGMQCVLDGGLFSLTILWYLVGLLLPGGLLRPKRGRTPSKVFIVEGTVISTILTSRSHTSHRQGVRSFRLFLACMTSLRFGRTGHLSRVKPVFVNLHILEKPLVHRKLHISRGPGSYTACRDSSRTFRGSLTPCW